MDENKMKRSREKPSSSVFCPTRSEYRLNELRGEQSEAPNIRLPSGKAPDETKVTQRIKKQAEGILREEVRARARRKGQVAGKGHRDVVERSLEAQA